MRFASAVTERLKGQLVIGVLPPDTLIVPEMGAEIEISTSKSFDPDPDEEEEKVKLRVPFVIVIDPS